MLYAEQYLQVKHQGQAKTGTRAGRVVEQSHRLSPSKADRLCDSRQAPYECRLPVQSIGMGRSAVLLVCHVCG